jgi:hypothetical protein
LSRRAGATGSLGSVNAARAEAYGRLMQTVRQEGAGALEPAEQAQLREAADAVFFSEDVEQDAEAREALAEAGELAGRLVGDGRWSSEQAERLLQDLEDCGPVARLAHR